MRSLSRREGLAAIGAAVGGVFLPAEVCAADPEPTFTLSVAIADVAHEGVTTPACEGAWLDAQVAEAERIFAAHGVHFREGPRRKLPASAARLESREDRDALSSSVDKNVINVFVVASLRDVDDPSIYRRGVHWRDRKNLARHYAIVIGGAFLSVLAHELGHFFGQAHSAVQDNVMSYDRTGKPAFFDAKQGKAIRASAKAYVARKELLVAG